MNPSFSNADSATVVQAPGREFLLLYSDSFTWHTVVRVNRGSQVTFGPTTVTIGSRGPMGHTIAANDSSVGWLYMSPAFVNPPQSGIYFHLMDFDGKIIGSEVEIAPTSTLNPCCVDLIWAEGEFTAVYSPEAPIPLGLPLSVAVRRISATGQVLTPETIVWPNTPGIYITLPQVARVGTAIGVFYSHNQDSLWGTWVDTQGNTLVPPREYVPQSGTLLMAPIEAYGQSDHASVFYRLGGAYEIQVTPAGAVTVGPRQFVELAVHGEEAVGPSPGGRGVGFFGAGLNAHLRRSNDELSPPSDESMQIANPTPTPTDAGNTSTAYGHRAYGVAWEDDRYQMWSYDVFFQVAPGYELAAVGAGPSPSNAPEVKLWRPEGVSGAPHATITPYGASGYGSNVAAGDITGDDVDEVLTGPGPGPGFGPQVRAFTWQGTALQKVNFYAYGTLKYGVKPAAGRLDADTAWEMLTTPGPGAVFGPHVRGFDYDNVQVRAMAKVSFYAYGTLKYGANVAAGSIDADAFDEILTGPGPGSAFSTQLRGFDYDNASVRALAKVNAFVFPGLTHGLHVASGETDGDAFSEIGGAPGPSAASPSLIAVLDYDGTGLAQKPGCPFDVMGSLYGSQLSFASWADADMPRELLVSRGPDASNDGEVRVRDDALGGFAALASWDAYPGRTHGATLASVFPGF